MLLNGIRGFCMALADSVPGVSGGTVAFLLGFYDEFINSLNDLMGRDRGKRKKALLFLAKLGVGWIAGFCLSVLILSGLYQISSVFMGLTLFAIPMVIKEEREVLRGHYGNLLFTLAGMSLVFCISYFFNPAGGTGGGTGINVSVEHLSFGLAVYVFITAMVAITAMVLPGISGSTLLLIFGVYVPIIGAVKEFLHFNFNYVPVLAIFGLGIITGIVGVIKLIKLCLKRYRSQTIYAILGLMAGSLYAITMGPTTLDVWQPPMSLQTFHVPFFLLGGLILGALEYMKLRIH